jgi:hypothetical protein
MKINYVRYQTFYSSFEPKGRAKYTYWHRGIVLVGSAMSLRRAPERELERMHDLYRERYSDFTVKHFHVQLVQRHDYKLCYRGDQAIPAVRRAGGESQAPERPPQEEGTPAAAGNAAVPGWLDPSLDRGAGARSRSHRHT